MLELQVPRIGLGWRRKEQMLKLKRCLFLNPLLRFPVYRSQLSMGVTYLTGRNQLPELQIPLATVVYWTPLVCLQERYSLCL